MKTLTFLFIALSLFFSCHDTQIRQQVLGEWKAGQNLIDNFNRGEALLTDMRLMLHDNGRGRQTLYVLLRKSEEETVSARLILPGTWEITSGNLFFDIEEKRVQVEVTAIMRNGVDISAQMDEAMRQELRSKVGKFILSLFEAAGEDKMYYKNVSVQDDLLTLEDEDLGVVTFTRLHN